MTGNLKKTPGCDPSSGDSVSICQWNLNRGLSCNFIKLLAGNFIKLSFLPVYIYRILPVYIFW